MDLKTSKQQTIAKKLVGISCPRELRCALFFIFVLLSSMLILKFLSPFEAKSLFRFGFLSQIVPADDRPKSSPGSPCDYSNGKWVWDESYPRRLYNESCPFLDPGFRCSQNGRRYEDYRKWRWQPHGCDLPLFNASEFLERSRNGRIVFAGDSIGRNQWESLLCMLARGVSNMSNIYELHGNPISKHKGFLAMHFEEYNLTVEYYRTPFLSVIGRPPKNSPSQVRATIRVDELHWYSRLWVGADVLIFNAGHWWNQDKTLKMGCYFQEGEKVNMTMTVKEAFRRSLQTLKSWVSSNLVPRKSTHVFFRSYSPVHYRNGTWNQGGECDHETQPEKDSSKLEMEPYSNLLVYDVIKQSRHVNRNREVEFLNITYLSQFRKDGHPSKYREPGTAPEAPQDCSHWCLPGVPDTWNELLYAHLVS